MTRSRKFAILAILLLLGAGWQPAFLDQVRYPLALMTSWPVRLAAKTLSFEAPVQQSTQAQCLEAERQWLRFAAQQEETVRLVATQNKSQRIFLAQGHRQGVQVGACVSSRGRFIGRVDAVSENLARVRLATHSGCRFVGFVASKDAKEGRRQGLLLRGGFGRIRSCDDMEIADEYRDAEVWAACGRSADSQRVLVGQVRSDDDFGANVVEPALSFAQLKEFVIHDLETGRPLVPKKLKLFDERQAQILTTRDASEESPSLWLSLGRADGIQMGSYVGFNGRLIGRIARLGTWSSRMVRLEDLDESIRCDVLKVDSDTATEALLAELELNPNRHAEDETGLAKGRYYSSASGAMSLPQGLWLGDWDSQNTTPEGRLFAPLNLGSAATVTIYGSRFEIELFRLGYRKSSG